MDLIEERARLIAENRTHGAGWLARQAVEAVAEVAESGGDPVEAGRRLAAARPAIGAIAGALGRLLAPAMDPEQLVEEARALIDRRDRAATSIAVLAKPALGGRVMTHSASATVREAVIHAGPERVVCTVSAPYEEGRELADDLLRAGLAVDLVADEDAEHALGTVDVFLVGADCVFRDGALVNKVGTATLARAAADAALPVLVACETLKIVPVNAGDDTEGPWKTLASEDEPFELTPPELITRFITDEGILEPDEIASLADRTPFLRAGWELLHTPAA
jgi:translation initiation factor eIF-2B subunit delta/methylthioribose-1-phosphate isomerase